jgi:chaperonin GroES
MKFQPVPDHVLIDPAPEKTHSAGGIILVKKSMDAKKGIVVAVAHQSVLQMGDQVLFEANAGDPYEEEGGKYLILREENVIAVI